MEIINAVQHNGLLAASGAFAAGLAIANYALIIQKAVGSKFVTNAIRKDPDLAEKVVAELQKDVDQVAEAAKASAAPKP